MMILMMMIRMIMTEVTGHNYDINDDDKDDNDWSYW